MSRAKHRTPEQRRRIARLKAEKKNRQNAAWWKRTLAPWMDGLSSTWSAEMNRESPWVSTDRRQNDTSP
jgi:hypothetical protein